MKTNIIVTKDGVATIVETEVEVIEREKLTFRDVKKSIGDGCKQLILDAADATDAAIIIAGGSIACLAEGCRTGYIDLLVEGIGDCLEAIYL